MWEYFYNVEIKFLVKILLRSFKCSFKSFENYHFFTKNKYLLWDNSTKLKKKYRGIRMKDSIKLCKYKSIRLFINKSYKNIKRILYFL